MVKLNWPTEIYLSPKHLTLKKYLVPIIETNSRYYDIYKIHHIVFYTLKKQNKFTQNLDYYEKLHAFRNIPYHFSEIFQQT